MVTIHLALGFRFVIFLDDHDPAHVHVFGDGQMKVTLVGGDGPRLLWAVGMKRGDVRKAMAIVTERQDHFLARWNDIHG
jgi:hypothetical protein